MTTTMSNWPTTITAHHRCARAHTNHIKAILNFQIFVIIRWPQHHRESDHWDKRQMHDIQIWIVYPSGIGAKQTCWDGNMCLLLSRHMRCDFTHRTIDEITTNTYMQCIHVAENGEHGMTMCAVVHSGSGDDAVLRLHHSLWDKSHDVHVVHRTCVINNA